MSYKSQYENAMKKFSRDEYSNPPQVYMDAISPYINAARELLEMNGEIPVTAVVGNLTTKEQYVVSIKTKSCDSKDESAQLISATAQKFDADYILMIGEAWDLCSDKKHQSSKIIEKYGSIGASPHAISICHIALETRHGAWVASMQIKPKGYSKRKKTFGEAKFLYLKELGGRFAQLIPKREGEEHPMHLQ